MESAADSDTAYLVGAITHVQSALTMTEITLVNMVFVETLNGRITQ